MLDDYVGGHFAWQHQCLSKHPYRLRNDVRKGGYDDEVTEVLVARPAEQVRRHGGGLPQTNGTFAGRNWTLYARFPTGTIEFGTVASPSIVGAFAERTHVSVEACESLLPTRLGSRRQLASRVEARGVGMIGIH
jgi:hypothetical protein